MNRSLRSSFVFIGILACIAMAGEDVGEAIGLKLIPSGFSFLQMGQIVNGGYDKRKGVPLDRMWFQNLIGGISVHASLNAKDSLILAMEINLYNDFPRTKVPQKSRELGMYTYISQAKYSHSFGSVEMPFLKISGGYFPFKYNKDVRNLGEYLFRTGTYPQYIANFFDFPLARLLGLDVTVNPAKNLKLDALLYSNIEWYAVNDWNLAGIASYNFFDFLEIGIGASINSLISVDREQTTPIDEATKYIKGNDTLNYTFAGSKAIMRFSIDPKRFLNTGIFGQEDLILYGEAAILGLKNYPGALYNTMDYNKIGERIPVMIGFNLPTFKLLDVLNFEIEWFGSRYPNDMRAIVYYGVPLPGESDSPKDFRKLKQYKDDNWKWSCYAKKRIGKHLSIITQAASDHLRTVSRDFYEQEWEEVLRLPNEWYYVLKMQMSF